MRELQKMPAGFMGNVSEKSTSVAVCDTSESLDHCT